MCSSNCPRSFHCSTVRGRAVGRKVQQPIVEIAVLLPADRAKDIQEIFGEEPGSRAQFQHSYGTAVVRLGTVCE
jgi:hypothetical protein